MRILENIANIGGIDRSKLAGWIGSRSSYSMTCEQGSQPMFADPTPSPVWTGGARGT